MAETMLTVGEIAKRLGVPLHRVEYLIRARDLQPAAWAGGYRVFSEADLAYIGSQLKRIDAERVPGAWAVGQKGPEK